MKKNVLLMLPILLMGLIANAQITVTNNAFPVAGQTILETNICNHFFRQYLRNLSKHIEFWDSGVKFVVVVF